MVIGHFSNYFVCFPEIQKEAIVANSKYKKEFWEKYQIKNIKLDEYKNETLKRQLKLLKKLGIAVLSVDDLKRVCIIIMYWKFLSLNEFACGYS